MSDAFITGIVCAVFGAWLGFAAGATGDWWRRRREQRVLVSRNNWLAHGRIVPLPADRNSDRKKAGVAE